MSTNNINDELEQVAPYIASLRKMNINNQSVPENYFDDVEEKILSQVMLERALFREKPNKEYFKEVEELIFNEVKPIKTNQSSRQIWIRYAASFVGIVVISYSLWKTNDYFSILNPDEQNSSGQLEAFVDDLSDSEVDNLYSLLNYNNNLQEPLDFDVLTDEDLGND